MKLLEVVEINLQWSDLDSLTYHSRQETKRSGGEHVSDVLKVLREYSIAKNMYTQEDREDDMPLRILLGLAFEESAARLYPLMNWQPGEAMSDDLIGSPDGLSVVEDFNGICVDEFKYTGKSQRIKGRKPQPNGKLRAEDLKDIRQEWLWIQQGMAYINLLRRSEGWEDLCMCRFHICWKMGDYTFPTTERYYRYLVQFEEAELRGNWAMMQAFRKELGGER
jgi:hypothetical protein